MKKISPLLKRRILMTTVGVMICSISVGFFKMAAFGVDPFQCLMAGLDALIPIEFGTLYVIVNLVLLVFDYFADKHYIGIATFINLFLTGYIVQFSYEILQKIVPGPNLALRIVFLLVGIVCMCFASAIYFTSNLGVSTYDAIALMMADTWKLGKFKFLRIACDLVCVIIGVALLVIINGNFKGVTAAAGIGTIITAFFMGPLIDFFNNKVAKPWLNKPFKNDK